MTTSIPKPQHNNARNITQISSNLRAVQDQGVATRLCSLRRLVWLKILCD